MRMKYLALAAGALLISGGAAGAATVSNPLHLRAGPGTNYHVVTTMPAGAHVRIENCRSSWCRVSFRGETGWASANYLGQGRRNYTARYRSYRSPTYRTYAAAPAYYGAYAQAPGYYDGGYYDEGPGFGFDAGPGGFGFGFGFGPGYGWHHGYHHGYRDWR